jgi:hypothetical protein
LRYPQKPKPEVDNKETALVASNRRNKDQLFFPLQENSSFFHKNFSVVGFVYISSLFPLNPNGRSRNHIAFVVIPHFILVFAEHDFFIFNVMRSRS